MGKSYKDRPAKWNKWNDGYSQDKKSKKKGKLRPMDNDDRDWRRAVDQPFDN